MFAGDASAASVAGVVDTGMEGEAVPVAKALVSDARSCCLPSRDGAATLGSVFVSGLLWPEVLLMLLGPKEG